MPNLRGDQVIILLAQHSLLRHIPVIALTSDESVETEVELTRIGATAVIQKSKDPRILCAHIDRLFVS
jgi:CheY-like chemotaxis protein